MTFSLILFLRLILFNLYPVIYQKKETGQTLLGIIAGTIISAKNCDLFEYESPIKSFTQTEQIAHHEFPLTALLRTVISLLILNYPQH